MPRGERLTCAIPFALPTRTNIKRMRASLDLTQEQAAQRAGLCWRHWQKIEAGKVNATIATLVGIASAMESSLSELFAEGRGRP